MKQVPGRHKVYETFMRGSKRYARYETGTRGKRHVHGMRGMRQVQGTQCRQNWYEIVTWGMRHL